jgi:tryptophan synthase alpha chain
MNAIDELFKQLRSRSAKAFMPFVTAGDPDCATTGALIKELVRRGANLIEIGFPYSDPIADGSVIQASYTRALEGGVHVDDIFAMIRGLKAAVPLVGMVSYSLVFHRGPERFLSEAAAAGLAGAIVPDLPVEEASELAALAARHDFKLIQLVTPTTPRDRARQIVECSTGFIYCVSVAGITGERDRLPPELLDQLHWLRTLTALPLCVGFGVSKPQHVAMLRDAADGVIVGSALVRKLEAIGKRSSADVIREIGDLAHSLAEALSANTKPHALSE